MITINVIIIRQIIILMMILILKIMIMIMIMIPGECLLSGDSCSHRDHLHRCRENFFEGSHYDGDGDNDVDDEKHCNDNDDAVAEP